jgi:hypothetical protein
VAWPAARSVADFAKVQEVEAVRPVVVAGSDSTEFVVAVCMAPVEPAILAVEAVAAYSQPRGSPRRYAVRCVVYTCPYPSYS